MASNYWRMRAEADMDAVQAAATERIARMGKAYLKAARELTDEVNKIIGTYAKRFDLTREEALARLKAPYDADSRAYGYRMSRAEALKAAAQKRAEQLGAFVEQQTTAQRIYTAAESYRRTMRNFKDILGKSASFSTPDLLGLTGSINTYWSGKSYSSRIWKNTAALAEMLEKEITAAYVSGKSNRKIQEIIMDRFGVGFRQAERIVRTETSYVNNQAALKGYTDAGIDRYEYLTAKDSRTCATCAGLDGQTYAISEAQVGVNMPPMHPFCRCTVCPAVESALGGLSTAEVAAWQADGSPEDVGAWLKKRRDDGTIIPFAKVDELAGKHLDMERKVLVDGEYIKPISKHELHRIQKAFKKNGGLMVINQETDEYLARRGVQGITYDAQTVLLSSNPTRATVFEELIHTAQFRDGLNDGSLSQRIQCEIDAKEKLLKNAKAYKLTNAEIRETKKLLAQDVQDMVEYKRREGR